jgi:cytochrome c biogenesis factor
MTFSAFLGLSVVFFQVTALVYAAVAQIKQPSTAEKTGSFSSARWASLLLHFGFALLALGVIGSRSLESTSTARLQIGQSATLGDTQVTKIGTGVADSQETQVLYGEEYRFLAADGTEVLLQPHILWYEDTGSTVSSPAIHSTLKGDTYAAILEWDGRAEGETTVLFSYYPMMIWLWIGGILVMGAALWYLAATSKKMLSKTVGEQPEPY